MRSKTIYENGISARPSPSEIIIEHPEELLALVSSYDKISLEDAGLMYRQIEMKIILSKYNFPSKPSSDGRWKIYVKDQTSREGRRKLAAKTLDELKNKVIAFEKGVNRQLKKTFKEGFEIVQEQKLRYTKDPEKRLSVENTISRNNSEYRRYFKDTAFEKMYLDEITVKDIDDICVINLTRYDMGKKAFLSLRQILKSVFDLAYQNRWIEDNPYTRLNSGKYRDMFVKTTPIEMRVHKPDEIEMMLETLRQHQQKYPSYVGDMHWSFR